MLRKKGNLYSDSGDEFARSRLQLTGQSTHQRCLSSTVDTNDSDAVTWSDIPRQVINELFIASFNHGVMKFEDSIAKAVECELQEFS